MRWDTAIELQSPKVTMGGRGEHTTTWESSPAFANKRSVGLSSWVAARSAGFKADAEIQVRTCDYAGQPRVSMDGVTYDVERSVQKGDFTVLTLARRLDA